MIALGGRAVDASSKAGHLSFLVLLRAPSMGIIRAASRAASTSTAAQRPRSRTAYSTVWGHSGKDAYCAGMRAALPLSSIASAPWFTPGPR